MRDLPVHGEFIGVGLNCNRVINGHMSVTAILKMSDGLCVV